MRDIKSEPDCLSFSRPWVIDEALQTTSARWSPSTSVVHWMRQGVRLTRRRCAEKKDGSRSGTKWSIHFFQLSRHIADNWGTEEGDEEDWRATQRHPSPPRQNRVAWMVLKAAPVHQTCGNCVSIKRFPDAVHVELSGESSWWLWTHSILIERLLRGY